MSQLEVDKVIPQSGTTLTLGDSADTITIPSGATLDASSATLTLPDGSVTAAKLASTAVDNTNTNSTVITGQTAETSIDGADSILIYDDSATALRKMTRTNFVAGIGGANTPAFQAFMNGNQTIANTSYTKLEMDAEVFDTDSKYDTSTYRFTPTVAGQYWVWGKFRFDDGVDIGSAIMAFFKNGTIISKTTEFTTDVTTLMFGIIVELDSDDYLEIYAYQNSGGNVVVNGNATYPEQDSGTWGAYRIIGA
jgi:hypothetical protein